MAVNLSTFNFNLIGSYFRLPLRERIGHAVLAVMGSLIVMAWFLYSPELVPTCRTMAVRALSPDTDVLVSGTSRVERGIDPRLFGVKVVNLSSGGLSYLTMKPLIIRAIKCAPGTRLVVIEFDIFLLKGEGLINERLFELGVPMRDWPMSCKDRMWYILKNGGPLSAMPRIDVEYYTQSIRANGRPPPNANGYNPYTFFRDLTADGADGQYGATKYLYMHRNELTSSLDGANVRALLYLLHWLDERNIRWALVTLPHLQGWISGQPDEWESSVENALRSVQAAYPGGPFRYWDASSELGLDRPHFHDGLHLNRSGVEIFDRALDGKIEGWLKE